MAGECPASGTPAASRDTCVHGTVTTNYLHRRHAPGWRESLWSTGRKAGRRAERPRGPRKVLRISPHLKCGVQMEFWIFVSHSKKVKYSKINVNNVFYVTQYVKMFLSHAINKPYWHILCNFFILHFYNLGSFTLTAGLILDEPLFRG